LFYYTDNGIIERKGPRTAEGCPAEISSGGTNVAKKDGNQKTCEPAEPSYEVQHTGWTNPVAPILMEEMRRINEGLSRALNRRGTDSRWISMRDAGAATAEIGETLALVVGRNGIIDNGGSDIVTLTHMKSGHEVGLWLGSYGTGDPVLQGDALYERVRFVMGIPTEAVPVGTIFLAHALITTDGGTQSRAELSDDTIAEYCADMLSGSKFPPAVVFYDGEQYWLADGFHRKAASARAGTTGMHVEVRQGTRKDALLYSLGANRAHGLRRTNADKRRAVETMLADEVWVTWSDRDIARHCGVEHSFVGKIRRAVSGDGNQITQRTVRRGDTVYTMDTSRIGGRSAGGPQPPVIPTRGVCRVCLWSGQALADEADDPRGWAAGEHTTLCTKCRDRLEEEGISEEDLRSNLQTDAPGPGYDPSAVAVPFGGQGLRQVTITYTIQIYPGEADRRVQVSVREHKDAKPISLWCRESELPRLTGPFESVTAQLERELPERLKAKEAADKKAARREPERASRSKARAAAPAQATGNQPAAGGSKGKVANRSLKKTSEAHAAGNGKAALAGGGDQPAGTPLPPPVPGPDIAVPQHP
jgi:hypothetical protein